MTPLEALKLLVKLKVIKRKIESGSATGEEAHYYNTRKEAAWEEAELVVQRSEEKPT